MYNPEYIAYMNEQIKKALNKEIDEFLDDYEEVRKGLDGVSIPYNVIIKIDSLKEKWEAKKNE